MRMFRDMFQDTVVQAAGHYHSAVHESTEEDSALLALKVFAEEARNLSNGIDTITELLDMPLTRTSLRDRGAEH